MSPEKIANTFFFEDLPVGYFEGELPIAAGCFRYVPLRGVGHLCLGQALSSRGPQRCYYLVGTEKRFFSVVRSPGYGQLELSEFDFS